MARKMRDSGVEWIGEVPEGWEVHRFKTDVKIFNGCSISDSEKDNYTDPRDAYPYVSTKDISLDLSTANYESGLYTKRADVHFRIAPKGSILMCIEGGSAGRKKCLLKQDVSFVNKLACFTSQTCDNRYVYYFLQSPNYEEHFLHNITGLIGGVNIATLLNMPITIPPLPEQRRIADYLDEKCAAIDGAVDELKRGIEDCKAWKKAIIFEAVTGKANVVTAKTAKVAKRQMRDSGIPWIGEIPEGWEVRRLKDVANIQTGTTPDKKYQNEFYSSESGVPWIKAENLGRMSPILTTAEYLTPAGEIQGRVFPEKSVYVCCIASIGKVGYSEIRASCNQQINALVFKKPVYWKFGFYVTTASEEEYLIKARGNVVKILNSTEQGLIAFPFPSLPEQRAIANYLDEKCAAIDALVAEKEKLISDLEAYKKSLIFELVTGKREVA